MSSEHAFDVTYWGATGSLCRPLTPGEMTDKLAAAIGELARGGALEKLSSLAQRPGELRAWLDEQLPFALRSTYGGNTTCIEIRAGAELIIFDAGSGLRGLGSSLTAQWNNPAFSGPRTGHILLSHAHIDHILALPLCSALCDDRNDFSIWATKDVLGRLDAVLRDTARLQGAFFPQSYQTIPGLRRLRPVEAEQTFAIGDTRVVTHALNHPGGSLAYRIDRDGRSLVLATDHEPASPGDAPLVEFCRRADLLYLDAQYLQPEYEGRVGIGHGPPQCRRGWGHGTLEGAVATAVAAGVHRLHLGHRDPQRDDGELAQFEQLARRAMDDELRAAGRDTRDVEVILPHEGLRVSL